MSPVDVVHNIYRDWNSMKHVEKPVNDLSKRLQPYEFHFPIGYFDGAAQQTNCGCGAWILLSPGCQYKLFWNGGSGTNMKAEVMALWGLLWWASYLCADKIWIVGDSKVLIDHLNHKENINPGTLSHWLRRIDRLRSVFAAISFHHIYREKNVIADGLSKQGLNANFGKVYYQLHNEHGLEVEGSVPII